MSLLGGHLLAPNAEKPYWFKYKLLSEESSLQSMSTKMD
jgi:hypothetical protein